MENVGLNIWVMKGETAEVAGFRFPLRSVIVRLGDGGLWVWSPIALPEAVRAEVDALGPVRHLVAPNAFHHLHLREWMTAYPEATVWAPPGLAEKRKDLTLDRELTDGAPDEWDGIEVVLIRGNILFTEAVFFHAESRTAIFCDLLQQYKDGWFTGWRGLVARADGMVGEDPAVPRKFRLSFFDRKAARASLAPVLDWPTKRVLIAHGNLVGQDGAAFLKRAWGWV